MSNSSNSKNDLSSSSYGTSNNNNNNQPPPRASSDNDIAGGGGAGTNNSTGNSQSSFSFTNRGSFAPPSPTSAASPLSVVFEGTSVISADRILLDRATGMVKAGRLTAIVSACGSRGDLLMLQLLAGLEDPSNSGTIIANCVPVSSETYRSSAAFVNTAIYCPAAGANLSVLDNLKFSLRMRSSGLPSQEAVERISRVLNQLQLQDVTDHSVSELAPQDRAKLAIASELVLRPDFVFIDLNTLYTIDTPNLCELLYLLGRIAQQDKIVLCVALVQPRWLLLEYFDDVLLMEHSRLYYCGTRDALLPLLYEAEAHRPSGSFAGLSQMQSSQLLNVPGADNNNSNQQQQSVRHPESCLNSLYILCASTRPSDILEPPGFASARLRMANQVANHLRDTANGLITMYEPREAAGKVSPNFFVKLFWMFVYGLFRAKKQIVTLIIHFVIAFVAFLSIGKVYGDVLGDDDPLNAAETIQNASGLLFFAVSMAFLYNILNIEPFRQELYSFQQHRAQGYYNGFLFVVWCLLSKLAARVLFFVLIILGLYLVDPLLSLTRLQHLIVVLGAISFSTLGLAWAVLSVFPRSKQLTTVVFVAWYAVSALFGGLFINLLSLPETLRKISFISLIRLGYEASLVGQFADNDLGCNITTTTTTTTTTSTLEPSTSTSTTTTTSTSTDTTTASSTSTTSSPQSFVQNKNNYHVDDYTTTTTARNFFCLTGDEFINSVGFDVSRKWDNLIPVVYIFLVFLTIFCFGLWWNRRV